MSKLKDWQIGVGVIGSALWLLALPGSEWLAKHQLDAAYKLNAGYVLGFLTAISGFIFWEIVFGRGKSFIDDHKIFRYLSYVMLLVTLGLGLLALIAQIFGDTDWRFNIGALIGGLVVGLGVAPLVERYNR